MGRDKEGADLRIGKGVDVHPFCEGRPLVLGGEKIPFPLGLAGHSDADVLLHAVCDAILGAAALGDIGLHFPDSDPANRNRSSLEILSLAARTVEEAGFTVSNVDTCVLAASEVSEQLRVCGQLQATQCSIQVPWTNLGSSPTSFGLR